MNRRLRTAFVGSVLVLSLVAAGGCSQNRADTHVHAPKADRPFADYRQELAYVHGAPPHGVPGPWVILGYRAGREAARYLEIDRGHAWDVQVVHHAPPKVQYTCMMDGFMAATGASPGKLNLRLDPVDAEDQISTEISRIVDGKTRTLRISYPTSIRDQIRNVDYADFPQWADRLDRMSDDELFEIAEPPSQR